MMVVVAAAASGWDTWSLFFDREIFYSVSVSVTVMCYRRESLFTLVFHLWMGCAYG